VPFDAVDLAGRDDDDDNDVGSQPSPRSSPSARHEAAHLHASNDYALVGYASKRAEATANNEYSALPATAGTPAAGNVLPSSLAQYYSPPALNAIDPTLARSASPGGARSRSPAAASRSNKPNVEYDRVMLPPPLASTKSYDSPSSKLD